jgi:hypothetical protein
MGMFQATGLFRLDEVAPDYRTEYLPNYHVAFGDHDGIVYGPTNTFPHVVEHLFGYYHSQGSRSHTAFKKDPSTVEGAAESDALIEKALRAIDFEEQVAAIKEFQHFNSMRMPLIPSPWPGAMATFQLSWPWVMNMGTHRGYLGQEQQTTYPNYWIDESKLKS